MEMEADLSWLGCLVVLGLVVCEIAGAAWILLQLLR